MTQAEFEVLWTGIAIRAIQIKQRKRHCRTTALLYINNPTNPITLDFGFLQDESAEVRLAAVEEVRKQARETKPEAIAFITETKSIEIDEEAAKAFGGDNWTDLLNMPVHELAARGLGQVRDSISVTIECRFGLYGTILPLQELRGGFVLFPASRPTWMTVSSGEFSFSEFFTTTIQ